MTFKEKDAILKYVEFLLIEMCEKQVRDPDNFILFAEIYDVLEDLDRTLETQTEISILESIK